MLRLRAVSDVAPNTYREISAKFCEALHHGAPNTKGLKGIVKGMKNLLNFWLDRLVRPIILIK